MSNWPLVALATGVSLDGDGAGKLQHWNRQHHRGLVGRDRESEASASDSQRCQERRQELPPPAIGEVNTHRDSAAHPCHQAVHRADNRAVLALVRREHRARVHHRDTARGASEEAAADEPARPNLIAALLLGHSPWARRCGVACCGVAYRSLIEGKGEVAMRCARSEGTAPKARQVARMKVRICSPASVGWR